MPGKMGDAFQIDENRNMASSQNGLRAFQNVMTH
jgi:hypothetical protein